MQCFLCCGVDFRKVFMYHDPPRGEMVFKFSSPDGYYREVWCCVRCGHFVSVHDMDDTDLYAGDYVSANYRDEDGIRRNFERIVALDPAKSDNPGRVKRVLDFGTAFFPRVRFLDRQPTILDVGSGLCVFLHGMKAAGWRGTALDPDPRAVAHARERVGVAAVCGDFMAVENLDRFDVVSFNKVLEHVNDPVAMLAKGADCLRDGGFIYVELPDGEAAVAHGPEREEFFIDHWHIFSAASATLLAAQAGFMVHTLERLREPSGKYTLRAFLTVAG